MSIKETKKQKEMFNRLTQYFITKGYKYEGYTGENDDSHKFRDDRGIVSYVKFVSIRARVYPKESVMVIVKRNKTNKDIKEFKDSNDWYGERAKRVFVISDNQESYNRALRLIDTI